MNDKTDRSEDALEPESTGTDIDCSTGDESERKLNLGDGIKEVLSRWWLVGLFMLWFIATGFLFIVASMSRTPAAIGELPKNLIVMDKLLTIDYFRNKSGPAIMPALGQIHSEVAQDYKKVWETEKARENELQNKIKDTWKTKIITDPESGKTKEVSPAENGELLKEHNGIIYQEVRDKNKLSDDEQALIALRNTMEKIAVRYVILLSVSGKKDEASEFFKENRSYFPDIDLNHLLHILYFSTVDADNVQSDNPDGDERSGESESEPALVMSGHEIAGLEETADAKLDGWYRNKTLLIMYEKLGQKDKADRLYSSLEKESLSFLGSMFFAGMLILMGVLGGPLILLVFIVLTFTRYRDLTLEKLGIRQKNNKTFAALTLSNGILAFLFWDYSRNFFGALSRIIFKDSVDSSPLLLFGVVVFVYIITTVFTIKLLKKKDKDFSLSAIGISYGGFSKLMKEFMIGIMAYFAAIPILLGGALIYQKFFKATPESTNPVFDLINNAKDFWPLAIILLLIGIVGPIFEEFLFRGIIYTSLRRYISAVPAIILVSLLFAFIHYDVRVTMQLFLLGAVLGIIYERTRSLVPSIIAHCIWNSVTFFTFLTLMK